jgi:hypothetical protein
MHEAPANHTAIILAFLHEIGLRVRQQALPDETFLPGIAIDQGVLVVDPARLRYPGDLLHEAGHLAVCAPERRAAMHLDAGSDPAEEMMAIAWSYAAALHIGLDPAVVFHAGGYRSGGQQLVENFAQGRFIALPMLQWVGMAFDERRAAEQGALPFPHMQRWLRPASPAEQAP